MKKKIILNIAIICAIFIITGANSVFAYLEPTGARTNTTEGKQWLEQNQLDVLVDKFMAGNICFADGASNAWIKNQYVVLDRPAVMNMETRSFDFPAEVAQKYFGVTVSGDYVSSSVIKQKTGLNVFFDPRGFILFSDKENAVDTNTYNTDSYQDNYLVLGAIGNLNWGQKNITDADFDQLRTNWYNALSVPQNFPDRDNTIKAIINDAQVYINNISLKGNMQGPFTDVMFGNTDISSAQGMVIINTVSERLYKMAQAYVAMEKNDDNLKQQILDVIEYTYNNQLKLGRNLVDKGTTWPTYQFTVPFYISNTLCLMYDDISPDNMKKYTDALFDLVPDPTIKTGNTVSQPGNRNWMTVVNRVWSGNAFMDVAILAKDQYRLQYPLRFMNEAFMGGYKYTCDYLAIPSDGWYDDGSMIFHSDVAYNTSYGADFLRSCSSILSITKDTVIDVRDNLYCWENLYKYANNNVVPFMADKRPMKITNGRHDPTQTTASIYGAIIYLTYYAPTDIRDEIWSKMANDIIETDDLSSYKNESGGGYASNTYIGYDAAKSFVNFTKNIESNWDGTKKTWVGVYNVMEKAISSQKNFKASVAMSSQRIKKYESFSTSENDPETRQWYINDGALFVYTGDHTQFEANYFANVNPYYLPGTTVDETERAPESIIGNNRALATNLWSGGVTDGKEGSVSMIMGNDNISGLNGKKSYFMMGDKIVCIGTGIQGGSGNIHTTVDNRIITKENQDSSNSNFFVTPISGHFSDESVECKYTDLFNGNFTDGLAMDSVGNYYEFDLGKSCDLSAIAMAWYKGTLRKEYFRVDVSEDGTNYMNVLKNESSGKSQSLQLFNMKAKCRYVRIYFDGNSQENSNWQWCSEIRFCLAENSTEAIISELGKPESGFDNIYINGLKNNVVFNSAEETTDVNYVYIDGVSGYVFLGGDDVCVNREVSESSGQVYAKVYVNHGINDSTYSYVMLPLATLEDTQKFSENPDIQVVEADDTVHAVKDINTGRLTINFFAPKEVEGIKALTKCSLMIDSNKVYVSDPTKTLDKIKIQFPSNIKIKEKAGVEVNENIVTIDITNDKSKIYDLDIDNNSSSKFSGGSYRIDTNMSSVVTKLYTQKQDSPIINYTILDEIKYGTASIYDGKLYYSTSKDECNENIGIQADFEDGGKEIININIVKQK